MTTATALEAGSDALTVDASGRVMLTLPAEFAGARITVERVGPTELRLRVASAVAEGAAPADAGDDQLKPLSERDGGFVLELMENPPQPTPALIKAIQMHKARHG